jgi:hypothetical protein
MSTVTTKTLRPTLQTTTVRRTLPLHSLRPSRLCLNLHSLDVDTVELRTTTLELSTRTMTFLWITMVDGVNLASMHRSKSRVRESILIWKR